HPLGGGLGSVGAIGQSLDAGQQVTAEDYYLQVGDEVGIHTLIAFLFLTVFLLFALNRSVSAEPDEELSGGAWLAGVALAIGAAMLHIWAGLEVSLVFWTVAGAVVGAADGQPLVPTR